MWWAAFAWVQALSAPPLSAEALLADVRLREGRFRMAATSFREVLKSDPQDPDARMGLARALAGMTRCDEAMPDLVGLRGASGWGPAVLLAEGDCHRIVGDDAAATVAWAEATILDPRAPLPWFRLVSAGDLHPERLSTELARERLAALPAGDLLLAMSDARRAVLQHAPEADLRLFELARYRAAGPEVVAEHALLDGLRWLEVGWPERAAEVLLPALRVRPGDPEVAAWRAEALRRCGDPSQAEAELSRVWLTGQDPTPLLAVVRAGLLEALGQPQEALELRAYAQGLHESDAMSTWRAFGDAP